MWPASNTSNTSNLAEGPGLLSFMRFLLTILASRLGGAIRLRLFIPWHNLTLLCTIRWKKLVILVYGMLHTVSASGRNRRFAIPERVMSVQQRGLTNIKLLLLAWHAACQVLLLLEIFSGQQEVEVILKRHRQIKTRRQARPGISEGWKVIYICGHTRLVLSIHTITRRHMTHVLLQIPRGWIRDEDICQTDLRRIWYVLGQFKSPKMALRRMPRGCKTHDMWFVYSLESL